MPETESRTPSSGTTVVNAGGSGGLGAVGGALVGLAVLIVALVIAYMVFQGQRRENLVAHSISHAADSVAGAVSH